MLFPLITLSAFFAVKINSTIVDIPVVSQDSIRNSKSCGINISDGNGDLLTSSVLLRGKCQGNGNAARITKVGDRDALHFVAEGPSRGGQISRTELALTALDLPFAVPVTVAFDIMLPETASSTEGFFYPMQFWQCSPLSPLAGVRVVRGSSHQINFMTRGDSNKAGRSFFHKNLEPGVWESFELKLNVSPTAEHGVIELRERQTGRLLASKNGSFGFDASNKCKGNKSAPANYRLKFGIYKEFEAGKRFEVFFDNIRITLQD